jgi:death-on-curing protein
MEVFLILNGYELEADVDEIEALLWKLASGEVEREQFTAWVQKHLKAR